MKAMNSANGKSDKVAVVNAEKGEYRIKMDGNKSIKAVFVEITEEPDEPGEPGEAWRTR